MAGSSPVVVWRWATVEESLRWVGTGKNSASPQKPPHRAPVGWWSPTTPWRRDPLYRAYVGSGGLLQPHSAPRYQPAGRGAVVLVSAVEVEDGASGQSVEPS